MKLRKILVPLDGSALAEMAIPTAVQFAKEQGAGVVLMRAAEAPWIHGEDIVDVQVHIVRDAEKYLDELADRLRAAGCGDVDTSVWYGAPATSIVEAARAQHADLIVMTSHGRTGIGRLILGSIAESVLRGTTTPILLLRATGAAVLPPEGKAKRVEAAHV
jgi:nucleotide-binding universal stress UspA family protein